MSMQLVHCCFSLGNLRWCQLFSPVNAFEWCCGQSAVAGAHSGVVHEVNALFPVGWVRFLFRATFSCRFGGRSDPKMILECASVCLLVLYLLSSLRFSSVAAFNRPAEVAPRQLSLTLPPVRFACSGWLFRQPYIHTYSLFFCGAISHSSCS